MLHLDRSPQSRHRLPSALPQGAPKVCRRAAPAIFSCAKAPPPFVPMPQPAPPQTQQHFHPRESPPVPPPLLQTVWPKPPACHPSFLSMKRQKAPPPTYSQKLATAKSFPVAENNPPPSPSPSSEPAQQSRCPPEPLRTAPPPASPSRTRDASVSARNPSN